MVNGKGTPIDRDLLGRMTGALAFLGPDAQHVWPGDTAGLGHALLRTTFESAQEQQPCSLDGQVWITADARVDGRAELIEKLRARGRNPSERSPDVELILHAYHVWGEDCVEHLIGDFAFALWDEPRRRLFCARDQFGVTPFYYARTKQGLVFSNALNCLHLHPDVSDRLNERVIGDYLLFSHNQDTSATFFSDIHCLPAAHSLTMTEGAAPRFRRYWTPPEADYRDEREDAHPEEWVERFLAIFRQAVTDRLRTDRIAVSMTGGMDSSSAAAVACQSRMQGTGPVDVCAYTAGFDWLLPDVERYYAGLAAQHIGIPIRYLSAENYMLMPDRDKAWRLAPEPRFLLRRVPALEIGERVAAAEGRVVLSGLGGDPAFAMPRLRRAAVAGVGLFWSQARHPRRYLRALASRWRHGRNPTRGGSEGSPLPAWIHPSLAERLDLRARREAQRAELKKMDGRSEMALAPFWATALSSGDPEFTGVPVKGRHPFFDVRLVHFLQTVPPVPWFTDKTLLRSAMRGILPESIRCRPKAPLAADFFRASIERGLEPWMGDLAATEELAPYVDCTWLREAVQSPEQIPPEQFVSGLLLPLSLAYWLRNRHRLCGKPASSYADVKEPVRIRKE